MYGVIDAVVARNDTRCSSFATSVVDARSNARSTASRLLKVGRAAGAPGLASAGAAQLRVELRVSGLKQPDERARAPGCRTPPALPRSGCSCGRRRGTRRLLRRASKLQLLVDDDAPRHRGEQQQHDEHDLHDEARVENERDECRSVVESQLRSKPRVLEPGGPGPGVPSARNDTSSKAGQVRRWETARTVGSVARGRKCCQRSDIMGVPASTCSAS